jgi:WD40 repeat protein
VAYSPDGNTLASGSWDKSIKLWDMQTGNVQTTLKGHMDFVSCVAYSPVLTEGGDFDKLGRGFVWNDEVPNCIHQNHIFAVRANCDVVLPDYLAYMTPSSYGAWVERVRHHEAHENRLVQEAFNLDISAED